MSKKEKKEALSSTERRNGGAVIKAPFSKEQVANINKYQKRGDFHPFTCGGIYCTRSKRKDGGILSANVEGLICPCGKYHQNWVYSQMAEKLPSKGYIQVNIPVPLLNVKIKLSIKWRNTFQNFPIPWFGIGFFPKKLKKNARVNVN